MLLPSGDHFGVRSVASSREIGVNVYEDMSGTVAGFGASKTAIAAPTASPTASIAQGSTLRLGRTAATGSDADALVASESRSRICRNSRYRSREES